MLSKTLNSGQKIPVLGFGTYRLTDPQQVIQAIKTAIDTGYRHFDTADIYGNHRQLAKAFKQIDIPREDLFITSKIWNSDHGYNNVFRVYDRILNELETDYLDLFLIHWPGVSRTYLETWQAMIELYQKGKVRSIGVSNFLVSHLQDLIKHFDILPAVNQIELHPYMMDNQLIKFCYQNQIAVEAWSPIAKGQVASDPVLTKIGEKYNKTPVQITLRWHIQHGFIAIPKSATPERIRENFDIWDFELTEEEMKQIDNLNRLNRIGPDPRHFF